MSARPDSRYVALDGLRGVAAACVVVYHYSTFLEMNWLPRAWLAVDLFVCLSGFVLAHAYLARLRAGMTLSEFVTRRVSRLLPLYAAGLALGVLTFVATVPEGTLTRAQMATAVVLNAVFLPLLSGAAVPDGQGVLVGPLFPFNYPLWSMFFELSANAVFVLLASTGTRRWLLLALPLAPLYLGAAYLTGLGAGAGWNTDSILLGIPRIGFAFFVGVALHEARQRPRPRRGLAGIALAVTLLALFRSSGSSATTALGYLVVVPVAVWVGSGVTLPPRAAQWAQWLGFISYPLYVLHVPVMRGLAWLFPEVPGVLGPAFCVIVAGVLACVLADAAARADRTLRNRIAGWRTAMALREPVSVRVRPGRGAAP